MLVIGKRRSKLLPTLGMISVFAIGFIGSASILYTLDPEGKTVARYSSSSSELSQYEPGPAQENSEEESNSNNTGGSTQQSTLTPTTNDHTAVQAQPSSTDKESQNPAENPSHPSSLETSSSEEQPKDGHGGKSLLDILSLPQL